MLKSRHYLPCTQPTTTYRYVMLLPDSIIVRTTTSNFLTTTNAPGHYYHSSLDNIIATSISIMPSSSISTSSPSTTTVSLAVAAAAVVATTSIATIVGLIGGYYYRSVTSISHREMKTLKVPKNLLKSEYNEELKLAIQLAMEAGSNMIEYLEAKGTAAEETLDLGIETKSSSPDFCTNVDIKNEKLIIDGIRTKFPKHDIIGEESVGTGTIPPLNKLIPTWIIDPIDGTTNFSSGLHSLTCVSIGHCINGQPVLGVIYAPYTNELYVAVKGYGSYRNGKRIYQNPNTSTKTLKDAIICNEMGYTRDNEELDILLNAQKQIMLHGRCKGFRQLGSGCLDLCYVASGRLDVCYAGLCTEGWKPWDYCAGLIIVKEAGCYMESIDIEKTKTKQSSSESKIDDDNESFDIYGKSVICAVSKDLLDELRSVILTSSS